MNVRTITRPLTIEASKRSCHQGTTAAQTSNAIRTASVEPTFHQLRAGDSSVKGSIASNSCLPGRGESFIGLDMSLRASRFVMVNWLVDDNCHNLLPHGFPAAGMIHIGPYGVLPQQGSFLILTHCGDLQSVFALLRLTEVLSFYRTSRFLLTCSSAVSTQYAWQVLSWLRPVQG